MRSKNGENEIDINVKEIKDILLKFPFGDKYYMLALLVFIRKKIETITESEPFYLLLFFCNWALHSKLDRSAVGFLEKINNLLVNFDFTKKDRDKFNALYNQLTSTISFMKLRDQINLFFEKYNLPKAIIKDEDKWKLFMSLLVENIGEAPLKFPAEKQNVKKIEKFYRGFPYKLRSAHVKAISLEKKKEIVVNSKRVTAEEREILNIKIGLSTGTSILIPGMELTKIVKRIIN